MRDILKFIAWCVLAAAVVSLTGKAINHLIADPRVFIMVCITEPSDENWACGDAEELINTAKELSDGE